VIDTERALLADVVARVREAAAERGVEVGSSELVGLLPEGAVADPAMLGLNVLTDAHVLERRIGEGLTED
jgi:glutamate formiminotransferase